MRDIYDFIQMKNLMTKTISLSGGANKSMLKVIQQHVISCGPNVTDANATTWIVNNPIFTIWESKTSERLGFHKWPH